MNLQICWIISSVLFLNSLLPFEPLTPYVSATLLKTNDEGDASNVKKCRDNAELSYRSNSKWLF